MYSENSNNGVCGCWQQPRQGDAELLEAAHTNRFFQLYQVDVCFFKGKQVGSKRQKWWQKHSALLCVSEKFLLRGKRYFKMIKKSLKAYLRKDDLSWSQEAIHFKLHFHYSWKHRDALLSPILPIIAHLCLAPKMWFFKNQGSYPIDPECKMTQLLCKMVWRLLRILK